MANLESAPNIENPELNSPETGADVKAAKKREGKLTPEELERLKAEEGQEQEAEKTKLSPEEEIRQLDDNLEARAKEIQKLNESIGDTRVRLNEARENLGLPSREEDPPSVFSEKDRLEKLKAEQIALEKQKEELITEQEKKRLIREEKEKILQEKLDGLFKEFEALNPQEFEVIFKRGKTKKGKNVESQSMGKLDPEIAKSLAKVFKEGIKLLPKILESLPDLMKKFDDDLEKEATERVEQKLEEEKKKMGEGQKNEEKPEKPKPEKKPEVPKSEPPSIEAKQ